MNSSKDVPVDVEPAPDDQFSEITDQDYAPHIVLGSRVDYPAQLSAIRDLLGRQKEADDKLTETIAEADADARRSTGIRYDQAEADYGHRFRASIYQQIAHSMAAVGMLAPLTESIFVRSFVGIRAMLETSGTPFSNSHPRWQWPSVKERWNCHLYLDGDKKEDALVAGILQLAEAVGLSKHLPNDLKPVLQALFRYRNEMLHNGFEWPCCRRKAFDRRRANWPLEWFSPAKHDNRPWVFYLTDAFIDPCLDTIENVLTGIGAFARELSATGS
jgi:hypothetical protein